MADFREGDWECPDCGAHCFASRETCFKCEKAAGGPQRREGDWDCPECGALVFANKDTCFRCGAGAGAGAGAGKAAGKAAGKSEGKAAGKGAVKPAMAASLTDLVKSMFRLCPEWKQAWISYCALYAEGWNDPGKHEDAFLKEFIKYGADLVQADMTGGTAKAPSVAEAASAAQKRPAPAAASAPPEKKKISIKKTVANKIQALNASGCLTVQIRMGAVVSALSKLEEASQLEALTMLEEQAADIEDPNDYLNSQAQVLLTALAEGEDA